MTTHTAPEGSRRLGDECRIVLDRARFVLQAAQALASSLDQAESGLLSYTTRAEPGLWQVEQFKPKPGPTGWDSLTFCPALAAQTAHAVDSRLP